MNNFDEYRRSNQNWKEIRQEIYNEKGEDVFNNWIKQLQFIRLENHCVILKTRNDFFKSEITNRYTDLLLVLWQKRNADILNVKVLTAQEIFDFNNK